MTRQIFIVMLEDYTEPKLFFVSYDTDLTERINYYRSIYPNFKATIVAKENCLRDAKVKASEYITKYQTMKYGWNKTPDGDCPDTYSLIMQFGITGVPLMLKKRVSDEVKAMIRNYIRVAELSEEDKDRLRSIVSLRRYDNSYKLSRSLSCKGRRKVTLDDGTCVWAYPRDSKSAYKNLKRGIPCVEDIIEFYPHMLCKTVKDRGLYYTALRRVKLADERIKEETEKTKE